MPKLMESVPSPEPSSSDKSGLAAIFFYNIFLGAGTLFFFITVSASSDRDGHP